MRSYVKIKEETEDRLHLIKEPGLYGYTLLVAFTAIGYGAASYSQDSYFWQAVCLSFGVFLGLACIDDYEECIFDKTDRDVRLTKLTIWDRLLNIFSTRSTGVVVFCIDDIVSVRVKEEAVNYFGKGHQVILFLNTGMEMSVTESFTFSKSSTEHSGIADKIKTFLDLNQPEHDLTDGSSGDDDEEDGFEHVTEEVIEELKTD